MKTIGTLRTALFVPATRPDRVDKALNAGADVVIVDLEDAVAHALKAEAREAARGKVREHAGRSLMVRVNALGSGLNRKDLEALVGACPPSIMLPKVESEEHIREIHRRLLEVERNSSVAPGSTGVVAQIESARGVQNVFRIFSETPAPERAWLAAFGAADYSLDLGINLSRDGIELHYPRARIAVACRAAGIEPPIDTPFMLDLKDLDGLRADALRAKQLGYQGKLCIHPNQVGPCNEIFSPTADELAYARRVVAAFEKSESEGIGALQLDGKFIDYPVVERSRRILRLGDSIG
ncbi:MAG: CoA ester lyase [Desulfobacterales bacterium]|jgi:citrate lyase subunit beta/citryl-CoA lyase|nr:CoA ester lyase [Desulfobacterales bacterium]